MNEVCQKSTAEEVSYQAMICEFDKGRKGETSHEETSLSACIHQKTLWDVGLEVFCAHVYAADLRTTPSKGPSKPPVQVVRPKEHSIVCTIYTSYIYHGIHI